jgi:hypothetical protein
MKIWGGREAAPFLFVHPARMIAQNHGKRRRPCGTAPFHSVLI